MKNKSSNIKPKKILLLLGAFEPAFYDFLKKERKEAAIYVCEGRPDFESSRLTCRALLHRKIIPTVIADNTAGFLFFRGWVKEVWVAYQTADKECVLADVGGLILGVLARRHNVPLYAFAGIKKNRFVGSPDQACSLDGVRIAPEGVKSFVPLIELVPRKYVRKIWQKPTSLD